MKSKQMGAILTSLPSVRSSRNSELVFKPGDIMIEEDPYACSVDTPYLSFVCSYCIRRDSGLTCPNCTVVHYCNEECKVPGGFFLFHLHVISQYISALIGRVISSSLHFNLII